MTESRLQLPPPYTRMHYVSVQNSTSPLKFKIQLKNFQIL